MKKLTLFLSLLIVILLVIPVYADNYQPLVVTFHDAYQYYTQKTKDALAQRDQTKAMRYYTLARIYATTKAESVDIDMVMHEHYTSSQVVQIMDKQVAVQKALDATPAAQLPAKMPTAALSPLAKDHGVPVVLKNIIDKQVIELPIGKSLIIERAGVKRFMAVDEGFIEAKLISHNQIEVTGLKRGSTFFHIWDDKGRTTIYFKTIFLQVAGSQEEAKPVLVEHQQPFKFIYSNDWSSYYQGPKIKDMQRQNLNFLQNLSMEGPTPVGDIDGYMTFTDFERAKSLQSYALGVSNIPLQGTHKFNLRFFDAVRYMSPLTMAAPHLRGVFGDVDVLDKNVRLSYSHGQVRPVFGFLAFSNNNKIQSYVDAGKIVLFPNNPNGQYAVNVVSGYGGDRDPSMARKAFSIEGRQKINKAILNAELARNDQKRNAMTSGLRYDGNNFMTSLNVRNINKNYNTILNPPSYQGEIGTTWATNIYNELFEASTYLDVYQNRLYPNPNHEEALNTDFNGHVRVPLHPKIWTDAGLSYVNTRGEISPRENFSFDDRVSFSFNTWNKRNGIIYAGGAYQRSRYEDAAASAFDRLTSLIGTSVPITYRLTAHGKYEYSWVDEPNANNEYNPAALDLGLDYTRELTKTLRGTWGMNYRREDGVNGNNSFLAGEDSVYGSFGLSYNPKDDVSVFFDSRLRRVWPKSEEFPAYFALDLRLGLRMTFGSGVRLDPYGKVFGYVFDDVNSNGLRERNEVGIPNVKVKVGEKEVTTNDKGYFEQSYQAKSVVVSPNAESMPAGYVFSSKDTLSVPIESFVGSEVNFGVSTQSSVYGIISVDKNNNAAPDMGDQFVAKVKVTLDGKDVQYTDGRGAYYFRNVAQGKHTVVFDLNTIPIEMVPLTKVKHEIEVAKGATYVLHFPLRVKEQQ